MRASADIGA